MTVGLVVVSHSARLAEGVCEVAAHRAPDVRVLPAGGMADGGVGTDFEKVSAALAEANTGDGAVLLYDLGSAKMVAELAVESLGDPNSAIVAEGPFVEGAVAAAVAAQGGKTLADSSPLADGEDRRLQLATGTGAPELPVRGAGEIRIPADALPADGRLYVNWDNDVIRANPPKRPFIKYGTREDCDYRAFDIRVTPQ
ncbi:MAG: dihydroxyacetone kinase phosphoryl donor subunit DhaM, partial [Saccharopolyspora rectivirgula]